MPTQLRVAREGHSQIPEEAFQKQVTAERQEEDRLLGVVTEMQTQKPNPSSPQRTELAKLLLKTNLSKFTPNGIPELKPRVLVFTENKTDTVEKCDTLVRRMQNQQPPVTSPARALFSGQVAAKGPVLNTISGDVKTYEAHVDTILHGPRSVKMDYFNFLNILIKDKKLGEPISLKQFSAYYDKLSELVKLLKSDNLSEYVLRFTSDDQDDFESSAGNRISTLTQDIKTDLISFGFRPPADGKPIIFWSGSLAKERALADESGLADEQVELLQALWGFDSLVSKKEVNKTSFDARGNKNIIHLKLIVTFSSILAEYAKDRDAIYLLSYPNGEFNAASAYWKGEGPVLMKVARRIDFSFYNHETKAWEGPYNLKDPKEAKVLDKLCIRRKDRGHEKGPKETSTRITIGDARQMVQKWKWYVAIEKYLRQLPDSTC